MDPLTRSRSLPKYSRSRTNSNSKLTPTMAAAMLSLRWPPSEKPQVDSENDNSDFDQRRPGASKASSSRKLYKKKSSTHDKRNNNVLEEDEPIEYLPVTTPEFHEVQTAWPGFDHEPVPNWEEKYMIAKPYPKRVDDICSRTSFITYGNDTPTVSNKDMRLLKGSRSRSRSKVGEANRNNENVARPKRIIYVERVGSCIK